MGLAHFVLFARRQSIVLSKQIQSEIQSHHAHVDKTYPPQSNLNNKIAQLKGQLKGSSTVAGKMTEATFEIAWILARNNKAFKDAEIVK